jgi:hypothetical protein
MVDTARGDVQAEGGMSIYEAVSFIVVPAVAALLVVVAKVRSDLNSTFRSTPVQPSLPYGKSQQEHARRIS